MLDIKSNVDLKIGSDRGFGFVFAAFFSIVAFYPLFTGGHVRFWALAVTIVFLTTTLAYSRALRPLNKVWFWFGLLLGRIVSPVVMSVLFFLVFTPIGLLLRACGKDLLNLKKDTGVDSYWILRKQDHNPMQSMRNQF